MWLGFGVLVEILPCVPYNGKYRDPAAVSYDPAIIEADKTGITKDQVSAKLKCPDAVNDRYEKSKLKLHHGILSGMTTRVVDEKIAAHRDSLTRLETEEQLKSSKTSSQLIGLFNAM
jgi:hypothetical protein